MEAKDGKQQLTAMVEAGTIAARKNPKDKRFWEFRDDIMTSKVLKEDRSSGSMSNKGGASGEDFKKWLLQQDSQYVGLPDDVDENNPFQDDMFDSSESEDDKNQLMAFLGKKRKKDEEADHRKLDKMSQVDPTEDQSSMKAKMLAMSEACDIMVKGLDKALERIDPKASLFPRCSKSTKGYVKAAFLCDFSPKEFLQ
jgi:hypothetical protein